jgi:hypothetical protein
MFKKRSTHFALLRRTTAALLGQHRSGVSLILLVLTMSLLGCRTAAPLPKVNLSEPGWMIRQGQAVWRPDKRGPEIAGEILLAMRGGDQTFVQFTKTPFPFVVAQTSNRVWQIEFPPRNKRYSAHGEPPARLIWLQLARSFSTATSTSKWSWHNDGRNWRLENASTGESLEGYFSE